MKGCVWQTHKEKELSKEHFFVAFCINNRLIEKESYVEYCEGINWTLVSFEKVFSGMSQVLGTLITIFLDFVADLIIIWVDPR